MFDTLGKSIADAAGKLSFSPHSTYFGIQAERMLTVHLKSENFLTNRKHTNKSFFQKLPKSVQICRVCPRCASPKYFLNPVQSTHLICRPAKTRTESEKELRHTPVGTDGNVKCVPDKKREQHTFNADLISAVSCPTPNRS